MPIYEYHCNRCGHNFEAMQRIGEDPVKLCPECNGEEVNRLISATSFRLKGTGWYATDFKDKPKNTDEKAAKGKDAVSTDKSAESGSKKEKKTETSIQKKETKNEA